jgi:hypothetical protein
MNPMKLSHLLARRSELLRQARLANLAFAHEQLHQFAGRVQRAGLQGRVTLKPVNPDQECYVVTLTAHDASQSVIEEHFTDEDLAILADVLGFATGHPTHELVFYIDQLDDFVAQLRSDLEHAGVEVDPPVKRVRERRRS